MRERHKQRRRELSVQRGGAEKGTKPQTSLQGNRAGNRPLEAAVLGAVGVSGSSISTEAVTLRAARPEQRPSARRPLSAQRRRSSGPPPAHGPPPPPSRPALTDAAAPAGSAGTARPPAPAPCWRGGVCAAGGPSVAEAGGPGWAGGCVVGPARVGGVGESAGD